MEATGGSAAWRDQRMVSWREVASRRGRELRRSRLTAGWTQRQLAADLGVSPSWIHRLETGQAPERSGLRWLCWATVAALLERQRFEERLHARAAELERRARAMPAAERARLLRRAVTQAMAGDVRPAIGPAID